jgi:CRISPR-associated protein Cas1
MQKKLEGCEGRMKSSHQNNASDPFNAALNYGYGFLEGEYRKAINSAGLEPSVGFLHDFSDYKTKQSSVYDMQEPFRWLIEVSVVKAFESGTLDLTDFYFTGDDYRYRFETEKQRFIDLIRERFNSGVSYKGRVLRWDTIIEQKATELGRMLVNRAPTIDFAEPSPKLTRHEHELRTRILSLSQSEAERLAIRKSTLHYLRKRASSSYPFTLYQKTAWRLSIPTNET